MQRARSLPAWCAPLLVAVAVAAPAIAQAPPAAPDEASAGAGASTRPVTGLVEVAHVPLEAPNGDVWAHRGHAYVGTWAGACPGTGVKVVDVRDAAAPRFLGTLAAAPLTSAEDVVVRHVSTPRFTGDLLAVGLQACAPGGRAGVDLWNVTDPAAPEHLAFFATPPEGVHELDLVQRQADGRVLALLAVPFAEAAGLGGDFRVVDATDPRQPVLASEWGLLRERGTPPDAGQGAMPVNYAHSARASPDGRTAYVSYWDAGVQLLDLTDPARPRFLGNTTYPPTAEGNAHSVAVAPDRNLLVLADEDFHHRTPFLRVASPADAAGDYPVAEASFGATAEGPPPTLEARAVDGGRGCFNDTYPAPVVGVAVLVERGACPFTEKAQRAQDAGAVAVLVVDTEAAPPAEPGGHAPNVTVPVLMLDHAAGARLRDAAASGNLTVALAPGQARYDPWGWLRVFDVTDPARPVQVGEFATPHALNAPPRDDGGRYSVHNPQFAQGNATLVASWYADGVRVLDLTNASAPREVASWAPRRDPALPVPDVWGVAVDGDRVYASDVARGLFVLELRRA